MQKLISFVGATDSDILPYHFDHYRRLGVDEFHIFLHGDWASEELKLLAAPDIIIAGVIEAPYSDLVRSVTVEPYARRFIHEWIILADADEFLELPYASLKRTICALTCLGLEELPSSLLQRAAPDGSLPSLLNGDPLDEIFPFYDYLLAEEMNLAKPIWKAKYPLARIGPNFLFKRGNHLPHTGKPSAYLPIRGTVHHFKWRDRLLRSIDQRRGSGSNQHEQDAYLSWFATKQSRVPTENLKRYSRASLFEDGLLLRPNRFELRYHSALRRLRDAHSSSRHKPTAVPNWIKALPHAFSQAHEDAEHYLSREHLAHAPGRIALVTADFTIVHSSAGMGTAMAALAERLVGAGHEVHVFFCPRGGPTRLDQPSVDYWTHRGVHLHYRPRRAADQRYLRADEFSVLLMCELSREQWDIIHFHDQGGYAAASLLARVAGGPFQGTKIVISAHGPTRWSRVGNMLPWSRDEAIDNELERTSFLLADVIIFPSEYMYDWCRRYFAIDGVCLLIPNSLPGEVRRFHGYSVAPKPISRIVFFGRADVRKGINIFLNSVQMLLRTGIKIAEVVILGRIGNSIPPDLISTATESWSCRVRVLSDMSNSDAVDFLKFRECVAVVPSLVDNSPFTVYECLENGIPILASGVGGVPELILEDDRPSVIVEGAAPVYAERFRVALEKGLASARLSFDPYYADLDLVCLHGCLVEAARQQRSSHASGGVALSPATRDASDGVATIRLGVPDSRVAPWEPEVSDSASLGTKGQLRPAPAKTSMSRAQELNQHAQRSPEQILLFVPGSIHPIPGIERGIMSMLQKTGADGIIGGYRLLNQDETVSDVCVIAAPAELSPMENVYGVGLFAVRKRAFLALGGFSESPDADPILEWEFLNRLRSTGLVLGVPWPLAIVDSLTDLSVLDDGLCAHLAAPWFGQAPHQLQGIVRMALTQKNRPLQPR